MGSSMIRKLMPFLKLKHINHQHHHHHRNAAQENHGDSVDPDKQQVQNHVNDTCNRHLIELNQLNEQLNERPLHPTLVNGRPRRFVDKEDVSQRRRMYNRYDDVGSSLQTPTPSSSSSSSASSSSSSSSSARSSSSSKFNQEQLEIMSDTMELKPNSLPSSSSDHTQLSRMASLEQAKRGSDPGRKYVGSLQVGYAYDAPSQKLIVRIIEAQDIPIIRSQGSSGQFGRKTVAPACPILVRLALLPHKKHRQKTKMRPSSSSSAANCATLDRLNVQFNETFTFLKIAPEEVLKSGIRLRVVAHEKITREILIGQATICFHLMKPQQLEERIWLELEPRIGRLKSDDSRSEIMSLARSNSTSSMRSSLQAAPLPELFVGLAYKATTGRLTITVIKGSQFSATGGSKYPDTFVKLSLVSINGQEIAKAKTTLRKGQPNPLFKETFVFQVALFQLSEVSLVISVLNRRNMKRKDLIGWFCMGAKSTGEEELAHWNEAMDSKGEQICRWHLLCQAS